MTATLLAMPSDGAEAATGDDTLGRVGRGGEGTSGRLESCVCTWSPRPSRHWGGDFLTLAYIVRRL